MFDAPHGAVCAALLPYVMEVNVRRSIGRYESVARILTGNAQATAEDGVLWIAELCRKLQIPPLRKYGIKPEHIPELVEKAAQASSMKGNPVVLSHAELTEILERACIPS